MKYRGALLGASLFLSSNVAFATMQVDTFSSASAVNTLAIADNLILVPSANNGTGTSTPAFVDHYDGSGTTGNFANDLPIPGGFVNNFALHATCQLTIPVAGDYTFGTNNDDGLRLIVGGTPVITDDSTHATANFYGTVNLPTGVHALDLVFFEFGGGASVELYAKAGTVQSLTGMQLVGDVANGGLACNTVLGTTGTITITGSEAGSPVTVTVTDADLNTNAMVAETIVVSVVNDTTGETEDVTLTETGPNTGIFVGTLPTAYAGLGIDNDGVLNTLDPNTLTASYDDVLDASGNDPVAVTAIANMTSHVEAENVPTLSAWGLMLMSGLLGLMGVFNSRKKKLK